MLPLLGKHGGMPLPDSSLEILSFSEHLCNPAHLRLLPLWRPADVLQHSGFRFLISPEPGRLHRLQKVNALHSQSLLRSVLLFN